LFLAQGLVDHYEVALVLAPELLVSVEQFDAVNCAINSYQLITAYSTDRGFSIRLEASSISNPTMLPSLS